MEHGEDDGGGQRKQFAGVSFKLLGFTPSIEWKYKLELENRGGVPSPFFGPDSNCTHVIVNAISMPSHHELCKKAYKGGSKVVNHIWLLHCIRTGILVPCDKGMYKPLVAGGITGALGLGICCSGYGPEKEEEIQVLVKLIGATFHQSWSHLVTHVICSRLEGANYRQGVQNGTKIINHKWLQDSLNEWKILPCDDYPAELERSDIMSGFRTPTGKSNFQSVERLIKSTGNKRSRTESGNSTKPQCARSLKYNEKRISIDKYLKPEDRIVSVQYPLEQIPKIMTAPIMKRLLLKKYVLLARMHNINLSLAGSFNSESFLISESNEVVELRDDVSTSFLTKENKEADKKAFVDMVETLFPKGVPADVRVWLKNIKEGWADALILHHLNMREPGSTFPEFLKIYYCLVKLEKKSTFKYNKFKESMKRFRNWYKLGFKWTVLEQNKDYKDPRDLELSKLQTNNERENKVDPHRDNVHGMLKTIKNTWSHPAKSHQKYFLAIMLREDEELLSSFQKAMYDSRYYGQDFSIKDSM